MALAITLPFGKKDNVKNLVFSILTKEYPLKIIELANFIRKRYGRSVTFQAVRKAVLELVSEGVLLQRGREFMVNKDWVLESKKVLDALYHELTKEKITPKNVDSIKGEVSVFTFGSLNELMKFWQDIIDDWFENFRKGEPNINCWQGSHLWEALLHSDRENMMMSRLKNKGIKSYTLGAGSTPLDRYVLKFYSNTGVRVGFNLPSSKFDKSYYVATYGETIVQVQYPKSMVDELENFFKRNVTIDDLNLSELSGIVNKKIKINMTVIKNLGMAQQINKSIISQID